MSKILPTACLVFVAGIVVYGWSVTARSQTVCGNIDIADPARVECRLTKANDDQRTADLASARARAEVEKAINDFRALIELQGQAVSDAPPPDPLPEPVPPTPAPAPTTPAGWPDVAVRCQHADVIATARPQAELAPFGGWRVATADCGNDIVARFYTDGDQIRVALEYQPPSLFEKAEPRAYGAVITLDGVEVARHNIEAHLRYHRWSWRLKEPVITRTAAELVAANLVYPFQPIAKHNNSGGEIRGVYEPLGAAGFIKNMRGPGARQDFGPVTEAQACYLATQDDFCKKVMFDQADSSGSWMWSARDPKTGAPLRFDGEHINTSFSDARFGSKTILTNFNRTFSDGKKEEWQWDLAHFPAFSYVPYLLTGDPYYLESLQFEMIYVAGTSPNIGNKIFPRAVHTGEPRATSWALRHIVHAALATPDDVPSWLVPKDYYRWLSRGNAAWMKAVWIDGDQSAVAFGKTRTAQYNTWAGTMERAGSDEEVKYKRWQNDYTSVAVGLAVLNRLDEWQPVADWTFGAAVEGVRHLRGLAALFQISLDDPLPTNWQEFAAVTADRRARNPSEHVLRTNDGVTQIEFDDRWQLHHGVINIAARLGYADADKISAWLDSQFAALNPNVEYKYMIKYQPVADVTPGLPLSDFLP